MRLFRVFAFAVLLFSVTLSSAFAVETDWSLVHSLTLRGINHLYNLDIDSAMQVFTSVSRMAPGDPRGPFFESLVHFYLYGLNRDEKELSRFLDESERVISVCEDLLDKNDWDAGTKFYLGGIYGYRGLAYQTSGSLLKAVRDGRKGYILLEEAVIEKPDLYDAHMGFGLFRYLLAKVPKSMKWVLTMLGFDGNLEGGLHSLRLAAEMGTYTRGEAKLYLAQFLFAEGRQDTAVQYLNELRKQYPENTLFMVLDAAWQHRLGNYTEAIASAQTAIELNSRKKIRYGEPFPYSTLGSIYFTLNDFPKAASYYGLYLSMNGIDTRTPNQTYYRAGLACDIAGDRKTALKFYGKMKEPDEQNRAWDGINYRRGMELIQHPPTGAEILLVKAGNEHAQKKYVQAIEMYREALSKVFTNIDLESRALYGIQQSQHDAEMFTDAEQSAQRLVTLKPENEPWIIPHAWFKLGQTYAKLGKAANARAAFAKVADYDDYDFQERLEKQVNDEIKKLGPQPVD